MFFAMFSPTLFSTRCHWHLAMSFNDFSSPSTPHSTSITTPVGSPVTQNPCKDTLNFAVGNKAFPFKLSLPFELL